MTEFDYRSDDLFALYAELEAEGLIPPRDVLRETLGGDRDAPPGRVVVVMEDAGVLHVARTLDSFAWVARNSGDAIALWAGLGGHQSMNLEVRGVEDGSLRVLLDALDYAATLLMSNPVQLALTLHWFWERIADLRRHLPRDDALKLAREALAVAERAAERGDAVELECRVGRTGETWIRLLVTPRHG